MKITLNKNRHTSGAFAAIIIALLALLVGFYMIFRLWQVIAHCLGGSGSSGSDPDASGSTNQTESFYSVPAASVPALSNAFYSLKSASAESPGPCSFAFSYASAGGVVVIERSTNLVDWTPIATNTAGVAGLVLFVDTNAPCLGGGFYRCH